MIKRDWLKAQSGADKEFARLLHVAEIVAGAISLPLDLATGVAVIEVLAGRQITLADGVIWNGPHSTPDEEVWTAEAAIIVSALSDLDHDGVWWRRTASMYPKEDAHYSPVLDAVLAALAASPRVKEIEP
jgi:hypothetical protein